MAKHCDLCNQDYADDLPVCPHCASAKKTRLASGAEDRRTQLADPTQMEAESPLSDSAIDLGLSPTVKPATGDAADAPPAPLSGISSVAWSALVEEPPAEHVKIDSPSDADLLIHGATEPVDPVEAPPPSFHEEFVGELFNLEEAPVEEPQVEVESEVVDLTAEPPAEEPSAQAPQAEAESEVVDLSASPPESAEVVSDSAVDFGASPAELVEDGSGAFLAAAPPSDSQVFVAELASDASKVDLVSDSGIDFGAEDVAEVAAEKSPSGRDLIAEAVEAGVDPNTPAAELTEQVALDAVVADEHSSAVDLGAPALAGFEAISSVSGAEIVDLTEGSGINLEGLSVPSGSGSKVRSPSESSVDLGSQPEIAALSPSGEELGAAVVADSGLDLGDVSSLTAAAANDSDLALESLLAGADSGTPPAEESAALVEEEAVAEVTDEEAALAALSEPAVSESEVDDLLAGLEESPASGSNLSALAGEEVVADDDEAVAEEEPEAEPEAEEKPSKPVKQRSRVPALVGGTFLGLLLGAGGLIGARVGGFDVPALLGLGEQPKSAGPVAPKAKTQTFEEWAAHVDNGDWEAAKAGVDQIQGNNPKELAKRGRFHLDEYLQAAKTKINPQDPKLQVAIADLKKAAEAKNLDAIYDLGFIDELTKKWDEARKKYTEGVNASPDKSVQKQQFQAALDRVELKATDKVPGAAFAPLPQRVEDRVALLALLLIGLQQPPAGQPPAVPAGQAPADSEEAGFAFWEAAKEARKGDFDKAVRAIDKARATHDQRRFTRLRKSQNPLSDPTEDIFLRCCDDLKQYWQLEGHLRDRNYLTDKNTVQAALQDLLNKADGSAETLKGVADKFIKEKIITLPEEVGKGVDRLIAAKKDAETKAADLMTQLDKSTKESTALADKLKTAETTIKDRDAMLKTAAEAELKLKADNDDLKTTLKKIADQLAAAKLLDPKGKPNVGEAVKKAVDLAKIKDPQGLIRTQKIELDQASDALKQRWRPEEMMPLWLTLLEQNRNRAELAAKAAIDVERVKADPEATEGQNGQARIVLGLALRNTEKFDEAKTVLQGARKAVDKAEWLIVADAALREVSDPAAYYAGQAQKLYDGGQMNAALAVLARAMQTLPAKDQARLFAQRSLIELDAARSKVKGTLPPSEPLLIAAKKDAAEAVKAGLAEGHYATGRIAEELGQWSAAIESYRKAMAAHPALDADGSRYRISLARVLIQPRAARPGPLAPMPDANKVGWRDPAPYPARQVREARQFLLMVLVGLQAPGLPDEDAGLQEAEKLADEILKAPANTVPFNVRAQALAIKGRWTPALQTYIEGIRPLLPREYGNGLLYLIQNHPRLKRPDTLRIPNPAEAERNFGSGLNFYFDRDFANAERAFLVAIENNSQDARYFYFLGLSRLGQNRRRDASADFDEGALLEHLNRPSPAAVSESLERIQGPNRRIVNEIRNRPEILPERR